jgi:hypothetical protein
VRQGERPSIRFWPWGERDQDRSMCSEGRAPSSFVKRAAYTIVCSTCRSSALCDMLRVVSNHSAS